VSRIVGSLPVAIQLGTGPFYSVKLIRFRYFFSILQLLKMLGCKIISNAQTQQEFIYKVAVHLKNQLTKNQDKTKYVPSSI
jgi:hypothetical protein